VTRGLTPEAHRLAAIFARAVGDRITEALPLMKHCGMDAPLGRRWDTRGPGGGLPPRRDQPGFLVEVMPQTTEEAPELLFVKRLVYLERHPLASGEKVSCR
jgi:hypothetical protein